MCIKNKRFDLYDIIVVPLLVITLVINELRFRGLIKEDKNCMLPKKYRLQMILIRVLLFVSLISVLYTIIVVTSFDSNGIIIASALVITLVTNELQFRNSIKENKNRMPPKE